MSNNSGALAPRAKEQLATIKEYLEKAAPSFANVLPKHLTADRLVKIALAATSAKPELLACTPVSLVRAVMVAAQLGLEAGGVLGEAYLVPYGTVCTLIPGYRGLISLARRSGQVSSIEAHVVRRGDIFKVRYGLNPTLEHEPNLDGFYNEDGEEEPPGELGERGARAFYAIARLTDGTTQFDVMSKAEVDAIRARSKAAHKGPWVTDYDEMGKKTVIRRLSKTLPMSVNYANALALQANAEAGEARMVGLSDIKIPLPELGEVIDAENLERAEQAAAPTKTDEVKDRVRKIRSDAGRPRNRKGEVIDAAPAAPAPAPAPPAEAPAVEPEPAPEEPAAEPEPVKVEPEPEPEPAAPAPAPSGRGRRGTPGRPEAGMKTEPAKPAAVNELSDEERANPSKPISREKVDYINSIYDAAFGEADAETWAGITGDLFDRYCGTADITNGEFDAIVEEINKRADARENGTPEADEIPFS